MSDSGLRSKVGRHAEDAACEFLKRQGLLLLQRNYRAPGGEIDLVMEDDGVLVFVEVRARSDRTFMHPAESIGPRKQRRLIHAGLRYLQDSGTLHSRRARFDVICVTGGPESGKMEWIRNAFSA